MTDARPVPPSQAPGPLHSIGDAAEAAGLTPAALRMWEERYGRPRAIRLPSGHRRYTDEQVRWLRRVADALAQGHRPGHVVHLDEGELTALLSQAAPEQALGAGPQRMLAWLASAQIDEIRAWLQARWDRRDYLAFLREEIAPLLVAVGRAWADGTLAVRHEHLLSEILEDDLRSRRHEYKRVAGAPCVLLSTLPGELHDLGLQMAALGAAAHGLRVHVLGVNTPLESIARAASELRASVVAVSVSVSGGGLGTDRALTRLRELLPADVRLVAGGMGMRRARRAPRGVECPEGLAGWDELLRALARGTPATT